MFEADGDAAMCYYYRGVQLPVVAPTWGWRKTKLRWVDHEQRIIQWEVFMHLIANFHRIVLAAGGDRGGTAVGGGVVSCLGCRSYRRMGSSYFF